MGALGLVAPARAEDPGPVAPSAITAEDLVTDAPLAATEAGDGSSVAAIVRTDDGLEVVSVPAEPSEAAAVVSDLEREPDVVDAFVDEPATIAGVDALRGEQWGRDALNLDALPGTVDDGSSSVVAVVDTGVRASHPDLAGRVHCELGADFTLTSQRSTGTGCSDPHGHGTHVAGIVSAVAGNDIGVAGVSAAQIMPVRVLDANGEGMVSRIVAGIIYAAKNGADVINVSIVSDYTTAYDDAIAYALARGADVVVAAGNNRARGSLPQSPASTPGVIAVAATDELGLSAPFGYSGPANVIAAPGDDILSTVPDGTGYGSMSGTSMAAPHVAGVLARYSAIHPGATPAQVRAAVQATAIDLETAGPDPDTGAGLINPVELLTGQPAPDDPLRGAVPTTPTRIRVAAGADRLTVRWDPPVYPGTAAISSYDVLVAEVVGDRLVPRTATSVGPSTTGTVLGLDSGLERGARYSVVVTADNVHGSGQHSLPTRTVVLPTTPSAPRMGTPNAGPGAARVRWSAPVSTGGSSITGYLVAVYRGSTKVREVTVPATAREVRLAGLTNGRAHTFFVRAVNAVGRSPYSARSAAVTPRQPPGAPTVGRPAAADDAARVYWRAPTDDGGAAVSGYVVRAWQGTRLVKTVTVSGSARSVVVSGLANRAYYAFTVTARNAAGLGTPSARSATVRTA